MKDSDCDLLLEEWMETLEDVPADQLRPMYKAAKMKSDNPSFLNSYDVKREWDAIMAAERREAQKAANAAKEKRSMEWALLTHNAEREGELLREERNQQEAVCHCAPNCEPQKAWTDVRYEPEENQWIAYIRCHSGKCNFFERMGAVYPQLR